MFVIVMDDLSHFFFWNDLLIILADKSNGNSMLRITHKMGLLSNPKMRIDLTHCHYMQMRRVGL